VGRGLPDLLAMYLEITSACLQPGSVITDGFSNCSTLSYAGGKRDMFDFIQETSVDLEGRIDLLLAVATGSRLVLKYLELKAEEIRSPINRVNDV
jgi:hypothetical protein